MELPQETMEETEVTQEVAGVAQEVREQMLYLLLLKQLQVKEEPEETAAAEAG